MGSLVAELAEKLSSATNNFDIDEGTIYVNTSADTVGIGTTTPGSKLDVQGTMQVGVIDTGHDVKFFGATALSVDRAITFFTLFEKQASIIFCAPNIFVFTNSIGLYIFKKVSILS